MQPEPVIYREEAASTMFAVADILVEVRAIRQLLEDDDGQAEEDLEE